LAEDETPFFISQTAEGPSFEAGTLSIPSRRRRKPFSSCLCVANTQVTRCRKRPWELAARLGKSRKKSFFNLRAGSFDRSSDAPDTYGNLSKKCAFGTREIVLTRNGSWLCLGETGTKWQEMVNDAAHR
jgi:hypothetical protein